MGESSKKIKGDFGGQLSQLPEEIVLEIFSRLLFTDLKRCRCVRKSWYESIPSPHFSKLHHEKSVSRGTYFVSYILQVNSDSDWGIPYDLYLVEFYYSTESGERALYITPLKTMLDDMGIYYYIIGSCNGLLCLCETVRYHPVYICNPITREYITLPTWNGLTDDLIISGFGYDEKAGDYKVIRMTCKKTKLISGDIHRDLRAEVYTLGTENWREIGRVPFTPRRREKPGIFVNGVFHWMGETCNIVCFDIASEKFSIFKLPPMYNNGEIDSKILQALEVRLIKGQLCIFDKNNGQLVFWIMKQYGDEQSWTREDIFEGLLSELDVVYNIVEMFPNTRDLFPYVVSFVSHIDPKDEASSGDEEDCLKLGQWSKRLYPVVIGEDEKEDEDFPTVFQITDYHLKMRIIS